MGRRAHGARAGPLAEAHSVRHLPGTFPPYAHHQCVEDPPDPGTARVGDQGGPAGPSRIEVRPQGAHRRSGVASVGDPLHALQVHEAVVRRARDDIPGGGGRLASVGDGKPGRLPGGEAAVEDRVRGLVFDAATGRLAEVL